MTAHAHHVQNQMRMEGVANQHGWLDVISLSVGRVRRVDFGTKAFGVALSPDEAVLYVRLPRAGRAAAVDPGTFRGAPASRLAAGLDASPLMRPGATP